ncbi:MAG: DUF5333 domain-containing protein [Marivita sp.]|uniref:DUF5333 domain-containing protein n=1 Tax=Marivita sp. TaxID=2003365 RepID=UPI003EF19BAB
MRILTASLILALSMGTLASAKPALRDVPEIDNGLMVVAIADAIRKSCSDINARLIRAYSELNRLKAVAREQGYTADEVEDYVTSKDEKARMKVKAEDYLRSKGVQPDDRGALCRFGQSEIASGTAIGQLLR